MSIDLYVDGSWTPANPELAGWAFIIMIGNEIVAKESGVIECLSRQVDGELFATLSAFYALEEINPNPKTKINLYYDYVGIEAWATGRWKAKAQVSKDYVHELSVFQDLLSKIIFHKVKSHTGVSEGNDIVDQMAKDALLMLV